MEDEIVKSLKMAATSKIDSSAATLNDISKDIWNNPQVAYEETHAHELLTKFLEDIGFDVKRHYILETAFKAEYGESRKGPNIAILCEYDALPEIGHACGHNLIAEAGIAAAIGIKAAFDAVEKPMGKLTVYGTPAEESGGGKIDLLNSGAFKEIDVAMMVHPAPLSYVRSPFLANKFLSFRFHGKATHAAAKPWAGLNALDAAVLAYQNISCMRQQMMPTWRVHGVFVKGGTKPNVIPDFSELEYEMRCPRKSELPILEKKLLSCCEGAAVATGCKFEYTERPNNYADMVSNEPLAVAFEENAKLLGMEFNTTEEIEGVAGSTDMGNVSYAVPTLHPFFSIRSTAFNHTKEFTSAAGDPSAQAPTLKSAKAMAFTALDVYAKPDLLSDIKRYYTQDISAQNFNLQL